MPSTATAVVTLPTETQILITRDFDAPRPLVWRTYTEPELVRRWWMGKHGTVVSAEIDLRPGGRWRYVGIANQGFEVAFNGEYEEVDAPARLVNTEIYEGAPDGVSHVVTTFEEVDGRTRMTQLCDYDSREVRDMVIESGMETGMQEAFDALETLAAALA